MHPVSPGVPLTTSLGIQSLWSKGSLIPATEAFGGTPGGTWCSATKTKWAFLIIVSRFGILAKKGEKKKRMGLISRDNSN